MLLAILGLLAQTILTVNGGLQTFAVNTEQVAAYISLEYLSVNIDASSLAQWSLYEESVFHNPIAVALASNLQPAYLRFSGTAADETFYSVPGSDLSDSDSVSSYVMNATQWDTLNDFAKAANIAIVFGVNVAPRTAEGAWNSSNFEALLRYASSKPSFITAFELGNEPDVFPKTVDLTVSPQQLANDFKELRRVLDSNGFQDKAIFGPDTTTSATSYLTEFCQAEASIGSVVNGVSFHHYYGINFDIEDFYSLSVLDSLFSYLEQGKANAVSLTSKGSALWIGETAATALGGTPGASNAFADVFTWLDKLSLSPLYGVSLIGRQTFFGGPYGIFNSPNQPLPDYWVSVLFKRLVGTRVLSVAGSTSLGRQSRIYAFCANGISGGVTVTAININTGSPITFDFQGFSSYPRDEYVLGAPNGDMASSEIQLNGNTIIATDSGALPKLNPNVVTTNVPITIEALTVGLFVFPNANASACK